jgi:uncharacterized protein YcnI
MRELLDREYCMKSTITALLAAAGILLAPAIARAHVTVSSGPGFANSTQEIVFAVGHGCEGSDTYSVKVDIPAGVTSVRPLTSDFGKVTVEKNAEGDVIAVIWQKPDAELLASDFGYYKLALRLRVPNKPFTTVYFPTHQTCKASDGTTLTTHWVTTPGTTGSTDEPAPELRIVPARKAGWNKFTVPGDITDLSVYFSDALIVWKGTAAFSSNAVTTELAKGTSGITELTELKANDEIWVKY